MQMFSKAHDHMKSLLIPGETLDEWAIQQRLFALFYRRVLIGVTSGRFMIIKRGIFGGFDMGDFRWQDIGNIKIKVGIFGADLFIKKFAPTDLAINKYATFILGLIGFRKEQAQNIYRLAHAQDQSWREKRRVRELEELRAKSGGLNLNNLSGSSPRLRQQFQKIQQYV